MRSDSECASGVTIGLFEGAADKQPLERLSGTVRMECSPPRVGEIIGYDGSYYRVVDVVWEIPFDTDEAPVDYPHAWLHVNEC